MKRIIATLCLALIPAYGYCDVSNQLNIEEEDASPSTFPYKLKVTNGSLTDNGDGTASLSISAGSGDVTAVGDCATGACFGGADGDTLTFNNAGGDGVLDYDGTDFGFDKLLTGNAGITTQNGATGPGFLDIYEDTDNGTNKYRFIGAAAVTSDQTCTFENDSHFIPDSCVGDGTDAGGADTNADKEYWWPASATLPLEAADSIPPIAKDAGTNIDQLVVDFDDSTDECRTVSFKVPADITSGNVTFSVHGYSAAATSGAVMLDFRHNSGVADGVDPDQALTTVSAASDTVPGTAGQLSIITWTETVANLGWAAGDQVDGVFCRDANGTAGTDSLAGDWRTVGFGIRIPRA